MFQDLTCQKFVIKYVKKVKARLVTIPYLELDLEGFWHYCRYVNELIITYSFDKPNISKNINNIK